MRVNEIETVYEKNTGIVISETFEKREIDPLQVPAVLVNDHGPFTWGENAENAVYHSVVLEQIAKMAYRTIKLNANGVEMDQKLLDKDYLRKHGKDAYYVQNNQLKGICNYVEDIS